MLKKLINMIIILKTPPYRDENVLGGLFIALARAQETQKESHDEESPELEKVSVFFVEGGLSSIYKGDLTNTLLGNEQMWKNEVSSIKEDEYWSGHQFNVADIVMQLYGMVSFYYIPPTNPRNPFYFLNHHKFSDKKNGREHKPISQQVRKCIIPGIKKSSYSTLFDFIELYGKNLVVL